MKKIGLFYGSTTGNTETAALEIARQLGEEQVDTYNISDTSPSEIEQYSHLIFGVSTWGLGELQDDWDSFIDNFSQLDFTGKTVAFFGLGDQSAYPDTFIDAVGILHEKVIAQKGTVIGYTGTDGYDFEDSKALSNGQFVGLALDEDVQADESEGRITGWVESLKTQFEV